MIHSSCVSMFLHLHWKVMLLISLTFWVSLSGFEVTHLFFKYTSRSPVPLGFLSNWLLILRVAVFLRLSLLAQNKLKWFSAGSLVIQLKCWLWFCTCHTTGFHNWWSTNVLIGTKAVTLWAVRNSLVGNLHNVWASTSIPSSGRSLYLCLLALLQMLALVITIPLCIWGMWGVGRQFCIWGMWD